MDYWVKVAQLLGHESRGRIDRAVRTRDPEHRQRLLMQSEIAFMLRDCLVFAMEPEDRERAFELPEIFWPQRLMRKARSMDVPLEDPKLWGVDEIALVDDFAGRYVSEVTKPGTCVWNKARKREVVLPTFKWRIGAKWFGAVVPVDFDERGNEEPFCVSLRLRRLIEESRAL